MNQIVKQVRRGKRVSTGKSAKGEKSEKSARSSVKSSKSTAKVAGSKSRSSTASSSGRSKKKKTSRSLQQLHVLEKSVFLSRLEGRAVMAANVPSEPVPYTWVQNELSKTKSGGAGTGTATIAPGTAATPLERISSQSSLVGKSFIYRDDVVPSAPPADKPATPSTTTTTTDDQVNIFSMEELAEEMSRIECNDIFEPGPLSWLNNAEAVVPPAEQRGPA